MKRRDFLKQSTFASGMFFVPQFLKAFENHPMKLFSNKKVIKKDILDCHLFVS